MKRKKVISLLSYFIVGLVWYAFEDDLKGDELVKFHVKQAMNLFFVTIGVNILLGIFMVTFVLAPIATAFFSVLWIIQVVKVAVGRDEEVPFIGGWAEEYLMF